MQIDLKKLLAALPPSGIDRATRLGLALAPRIETDEWRRLAAHVAGLTRHATGARQTLTAWLGDVLVYGADRGRGLITECAHAAGLDPGTLRNAKMVCSRIPVSRRHDALSWSHHCEVGIAFRDPATIEHWLSLAEKEALSTAELRRRVRDHVASSKRQDRRPGLGDSVSAFRLMRELRAASRSLAYGRELWRHWSPEAAELAMGELREIVAFVDSMRGQVMRATAKAPRNPAAN
jgi:hypothetical protein